MARRRLLVVFAKEWDRDEFERGRAQGRYGDIELVYEGFELFRFPSNARLFTFDAREFVERLVAKWRGRIDGVFSNNEYFGALIAAAVAERLGLPGTPRKVVATAQHKYYSRLAQQAIVPQAVPQFCAFPYPVREPEAVTLPFPLFVKPVRATFSVLARQVASFEELRAHFRFGPLEELIIRRLVRPFADLTDFSLDAHHLIAEAPMRGLQASVDGYVHEGAVRFVGLCDAVMFPGTHHFERFVYPSRLPAAVQERMRELSATLLEGLGYRHGFFNVELFWDPETDALKVIEINPRLASQLAGLYQRVDGINPHRMLLDLATGRAPSHARTATGTGIAASLVSRRFDGRPLERDPCRADLTRARERFPDAAVMLYLKRGAALAREMKWLGSYRYAVINMGAPDATELERRYAEIRALLGIAPSSMDRIAP